ncbi:MAG TPA: cell wall-active antibiotics response protein [Chloroflexi bacterium]|jgi:hypothetical protein|nr:cell wall-active antibiotics response protein [Chloroflexota bacterium]
MPERERRHLLGPILLIFAGALLLLHQTGIWPISWAHLLRAWPLLLVLLGLDIVLGHTRTGRAVFAVLAVGLLLAILLYTPAAHATPALEADSLTYPSRGIETAEIHLELGVGRVRVSTPADDDELYHARISYDPGRAQMTADVAHERQRAVAQLKATQSAWAPFWSPWIGPGADEWNVRLNPDIPTHLVVTGGVNDTMLDLSQLTLTRLDLSVGIGQTQVILPEEGPYHVNINGGIGSLIVELPQGVEARIRADNSLGSMDIAGRFRQDGRYYYTPGYESGDRVVDIDIDGGIGNITLR